MMRRVERPDVCADGDLAIDRGGSIVVNDEETSTSSFMTRKRRRSGSRSPSVQTSSKFRRRFAQTDHQDESLISEQFSLLHAPRSIHLAGSPSVSSIGALRACQDDETGIAVLAAESTHDTSTSTKDILRCTNIEAPKISLNDGLRRLYQLSQEANELGRQQQQNVLTTERLQERVVKSERTYGEMLRESLELQRSIEDRRQQIQMDKQELKKERAAAKTIGDRLYTVVATIQKLSKDVYHAEIKHEDEHD